jgi:hypothetical protein
MSRLPGSIIKGTIREKMGPPLANVPVTINVPTINPPPGQPAVTDLAGQFQISLALNETGDPFTLAFEHSGATISVPMVMPTGAGGEVEVEIDENNEAEVVTTPQPLAPADRVAVVEEEDDGVWYGLQLAENQTSETFGVRADPLLETGNPLVYLALHPLGTSSREDSSPQADWRVYRASQEPDGETWAAVLPLGATSAEIHGRNYEVTALAAAVRLADGTAYNTLRDLRAAAGSGAVFAPGLLRVFVVTTRQGRFTGAAPAVVRVLPNAVLCDCAPADTLQISPKDLKQMKLTSGRRVVMDTVPSSAPVEVTLQASSNPILRLATLRLDDDTVEKLGLDLKNRRAGVTLTLRPSGSDEDDDEDRSPGP